MNVTIYIAANKPYSFPTDEVYRPIHVGACFSNDEFAAVTDDSGDNISHKNKTYCN